MLASPIESDFTGYLTFLGVQCTFAFSNGTFLEIRPVENEVESFRNKCIERRNNYDALGWIHGKSYKDFDVAFLPSEQQGQMCFFRDTITLVVDIVLRAFNFKDTNGKYLYGYHDLQGFNTIDFAGRAVDAIFPPKAVIKTGSINEHSIKWLPCDDYAKEFDTKIMGVACKLIFTIVIDRQDLELENTSLGTMHSVIRIEFSKRQDLSMIAICWQAVCVFLSFCVGQYNVTNLEIGLWDEKKTPGKRDIFGNIACKVNGDKAEDVSSIFPGFFRFQISSLGEKVGALFQLLNDSDKRPVLGFLPKTDTDHTVDRDKIRDLCTAFEVEFDYRKEELSDLGLVALAKELLESVKQYRAEKPDAIDDSEYSYISSSIKAISRPARKKIIYIYNRYKDIVDKHIVEYRLAPLTYQINTSYEVTAKDIGWIIKTRNSITHSAGVTDRKVPNLIYSRLTVALFCSVLERAGYSIVEISSIIDDYFSGNISRVLQSRKDAAEDEKA